MKRLRFILIIAIIMSSVFAYADDSINYVPIREAFNLENTNITWNNESKKVVVNFNNYHITFNIGSNIITTDEGDFKTVGNAYIENGVTYISDDSISLCSNLYLYHNSIIDAIKANEDEIMPLYPYAVAGEEVLMVTWHRYPESYKDGEITELKYGDVWVFSESEFSDWIKNNGISENMTLRMEQLLGMPPQNGKTHFALLWVNPANMYRPIPDENIDCIRASLTFPENISEEYKKWFNDYIINAYFPHKYPWTRLGYTYDWADNGTEYGLSEFVVRGGSKVRVEKNLTNEEFFDYITSK
ncbi:MAG: stalk domain-containing protein [Lachnospirales bacterium]